MLQAYRSLKIELSTMPSEPGVYQFFNKEDKIRFKEKIFSAF